MPIYEYKCDACAHELEALQKMSDDPLKDCPDCGKPALIKKISAAAFRLKGGGWYETDFKSGSKKNLAQSESSSTKKDSGTSGGTSSSATASTSGASTSGGAAATSSKASSTSSKTSSS